MPLAPALRGQLIRAQTDVRLIGDHGAVEEIHSILLMTLSPYFQVALNNNELKLIRLYEADSEVLKLIKEYAYEGKITGLSKENIDKVYKVADMYNIMGILNECQIFHDIQKLYHPGTNDNDDGNKVNYGNNGNDCRQ